MVALAAAVFGVLYFNGAFLPSFILWEEAQIEDEQSGVLITLQDKEIKAYDANKNMIFMLDKKIKVQDCILCDIDRDGKDELVVLCWKIGKYGRRRPFWVKWDAPVFSQHIYIYEIEPNNISPKWMASDIYQEVESFRAYDNVLIENTSPDGTISYWMWDSWGLVRVENVDDIIIDSKDEIENALDVDINPEDLADDSKAERDDNPISIIMAGDILLHDGVNEACKIEDGGYDYEPLFEHTKDVIQSADIAIVNQEVIIGGKELSVSGYPSFNAPFEIGDALVDAGFDVVCHATNHALDRGSKGIKNCLGYWKDTHPDMIVLGIYDDEESSDKVYITSKNSIDIAILNYTYGTNGISLPKDMPYAVSLLDKERLIKDLTYAEDNADFTIVCPHWGTEYQLTEDSYQIEMANIMTQYGADLIIGTHPHVIEPIKWIEADNGNKALCYYSIGNYVNWTSGKGKDVSNRMLGGLANVNISLSDDKAVISDFGVIPIVAHLEGRKGGVTTYKLSDYTEELADKNVIKNQDPSFSLKYCKNLVTNVWKGIE